MKTKTYFSAATWNRTFQAAGYTLTGMYFVLGHPELIGEQRLVKRVEGVATTYDKAMFAEVIIPCPSQHRLRWHEDGKAYTFPGNKRASMYDVNLRMYDGTTK